MIGGIISVGDAVPLGACGVSGAWGRAVAADPGGWRDACRAGGARLQGEAGVAGGVVSQTRAGFSVFAAICAAVDSSRELAAAAGKAVGRGGRVGFVVPLLANGIRGK